MFDVGILKCVTNIFLLISSNIFFIFNLIKISKQYFYFESSKNPMIQKQNLKAYKEFIKRCKRFSIICIWSIFFDEYIYTMIEPILQLAQKVFTIGEVAKPLFYESYTIFTPSVI